MAGPEDTIGASCPEDGEFYVCEESGFIGCCSTDPCQTDDGNCPSNRVAPMSFDTDKYNDILAQDCFGDDEDVHWFACTGTRPFPFMGCCAINPCSEGSCPDEELRRSRLSSNDRNAQVFLNGPESTRVSSLIASSTESSTSTSSTGSVETTGSSSSGDSDSSSDDGGLSQGAVIGIAVGATLAGVAAIVLFLWWFWRRARRSRDAADATKGPLMGANGHDGGQFPQDMKHQSMYSPNTASLHGLQSPQSAMFSHPNSPRQYHDRASFHPGMSTSPGMQSPHGQWAVSPSPEQQIFMTQGSMYNKSPPPHVTSFNTGGNDHAPVELPASMTQQSSELSGTSELPANPNTLSVQSYSGVPGRESEVSGISGNGGNSPRI